MNAVILRITLKATGEVVEYRLPGGTAQFDVLYNGAVLAVASFHNNEQIGEDFYPLENVLMYSYTVEE